MKRSLHVPDHLANERTFLAWLRTSVSMMGFGVVIVRLRELAPQAAVVGGHLHAIQLGLLFALIGLSMMPFALWHYTRSLRAIEAEEFRPNFWGIVFFASVLIALGVIVVFYLLSVAAAGTNTAATKATATSATNAMATPGTNALRTS